MTSSSGSGEEDNPAVETVLKLYIAIKNKNIRLSDILGDECHTEAKHTTERERERERETL
ncbi:hypothetical protein NC652_015582 [Populus alba x Populus x berolinensis]|nr:hypothetical protein NC652_015582 [Populus alba x Populus x berolinensis]